MTRGCPYGTLGSKVSADDELIRQDVNLIFESAKRKLAAFFIQEKAKGRLHARQHRTQADFCLATIRGAMLIGKVDRSRRRVGEVAREAIAHLRSFLIKSVR